ncbi:hypothetical protein ABT234_04110 [Streptomyces sp. NPDC001586]|uniref:hypothetical protein n=1 Tax=Streptomyces sp. NPDC001586 TaxID=3154387 RepID=UPI00332EA59A
MIGQLCAIVIDCPNPSELADFYGKLLSLSRIDDAPDFVVLGTPERKEVVSFQ